MKISFLVTYYNQEKYVRQSLDSLLAIEKPENWEILVGDDGSSDSTVSIVKEYIQKYPDHISLHVMPRDPGVHYAPVMRASANRLNLLEKCTGDYFCVLDGDDWYCDRAFAKEALAIMESQPDISVVLFGYQHVTDGVVEQCVTLPEAFDGRRVDPEVYLKSYYIPSGACVHRKSYGTERLAYLKKIGYFDDNDIVINSVHYGGLYCICRVVYSYRQTGISLYNSMNSLEQAVLNVQGYDVDNKLVFPKYQTVILYRNRFQIITVFIWRKEIEKIVGENKYQGYLNSSKNIYPSLLVDMLSFDTLTATKKMNIIKTVYPLIICNLKFASKNFLKRLMFKNKGKGQNEKT